MREQTIINNWYYVAIESGNVLEWITPDNIDDVTFKAIECYGLSFVGVFKTKQEAFDAIKESHKLFGYLNPEYIKNLNHLRRCYELEVKGKC